MSFCSFSCSKSGKGSLGSELHLPSISFHSFHEFQEQIHSPLIAFHEETMEDTCIAAMKGNLIESQGLFLRLLVEEEIEIE